MEFLDWLITWISCLICYSIGVWIGVQMTKKDTKFKSVKINTTERLIKIIKLGAFQYEIHFLNKNGLIETKKAFKSGISWFSYYWFGTEEEIPKGFQIAINSMNLENKDWEIIEGGNE